MRFLVPSIFWLLAFIVACPTESEGETYVTWHEVDIDRCASAWFISRFVDPSPRFVFFGPGEDQPPGIAYNFYGAKFFKRGSDCTFTTLVKHHNLAGQSVLRKINDNVNDVFIWRWSPGSFPYRLKDHIGKLRELVENDLAVYETVFPVFDLLFLKWGGGKEAFLPTQRHHLDLIGFRLIEPYLNETGRGRLKEIFAAASEAGARKAVGDVFGPVRELAENEFDAFRPDLTAIVGYLNGATSEVGASERDWISKMINSEYERDLFFRPLEDLELRATEVSDPVFERQRFMVEILSDLSSN